jgi:hypothetical protein
VTVGERFNPHRLFDGAFIPEAICRYRGLSPGAKLSWGRFYRYCGSRGEIYPSMPTFGVEIGCSENQARRYVHELIEMKFVECEPEPGKPNSYYFLWHPAFEGDCGEAKMAPPLQHATGVSGSDTPPACYTTPLQHATGVPLQHAGGEEESVRGSLPPGSEDGQHPNLDMQPDSPPQASWPKKKWFSRRPKKEKRLGLAAKVVAERASTAEDSGPVTHLVDLLTIDGQISTPSNSGPLSGPSVDFAPDEEEFKRLYPKNCRKADLAILRKTIHTQEEEDLLFENLDGWRKFPNWETENGRFIPSAAKWLEDGLWSQWPKGVSRWVNGVSVKER